jgi:hypothetical protein
MSEPRLLSKSEAAKYCGVTPAGYDAWKKAGLVPGPVPGTYRYDRKAIDAALDRHSGLGNAERSDDEAEQWLREHGY